MQPTNQERRTTLPALLIIDDLPIRISADGRWLHGDDALHPKVAILFGKCVVPLADGGYEIHVGKQKAEVLVSDAAFFVRRMNLMEDEYGGIKTVEIKISDGETETLRPDTFMMSSENILYCRIVRGGFEVPCKFTQQQYYELGMLAELENEMAYLTVAGSKIRLNHGYDPKPRPVETP